MNDFLTVENGTLRLSTRELLPHDPGLLLTKAVAVPYDPEASSPHFDKLLEEVLPEEHRRFLLRFLGYALLGRPSEQVFAILHGPGAK